MDALLHLAYELPQRPQYRVCVGLRRRGRTQIWTHTLDRDASLEKAHTVAATYGDTPEAKARRLLGYKPCGVWIEAVGAPASFETWITDGFPV